MISEARWERLKELLENAIAVPPAERAAFLDSECGGDATLRQELESLADAHEEAGDFLAAPAFAAPPAGDLADPLVGRRLGAYRVLSLIGRGGMGAVYRAVRADDQFEQVVAVKVARGELDAALALSRFRSERQILARLEHPGIARLLDGGTTDDGRPFFVMEHVEGTRIDAWAQEGGRDLRARLELFRQVCTAVHYAHGKHVVHRDLKPANILVTREGTAKLLDFGIAKILDPTGGADATATAAAAMTPEYASPEQLRGEPVGTATDVYSLGIVLYELLAGRKPHRLSGRGPVELARIVQHEEPEPPSTVVPELRRALQGDLDTIVLKALRKEPSRRYASCHDLAEDLRRHLSGLPVLARPDTFAYRAGKFVERNRTTLAWTVLVAFVAAAGVLAVDRARTRRAVAVAAGAQDLRIVPFTSTTGREQHPAFSPDGTLLAYDFSPEGRYADVYVQPVGGGPPVRLTDGDDLECCPSFSRDGRRLAFLRMNRAGADLVSMPAAGGPERVVTRVEYGDPLGFDWSPDGRLVAALVSLEERNRGVFAVTEDGRERTRLTSPVLAETDTQPRVSPDGRTLAFLRHTRQQGRRIFVQILGRAERPRLVVPGDWEARDLAWAADGRTLLFSSTRAGQEGLWRVAAGGGPPEPLQLAAGAGNASPAVSLRGNLLAYSAASSDYNIWRAAVRAGADPNGPRPWISSTREETGAQYSPDGRRIAFQSDRSGSSEIWVCGAEGRDSMRVTSFGGPRLSHVRWSPDGRRLTFHAGPREGSISDVFVHDLAAGRSRVLVDGPSDDRLPSWSHDGRWIYFASDRDRGWRVWKVPADGGEAVPVTGPGGFAPLESPDGRFLYFFQRPAGGLWRVPVGGGQPERVATSLGRLGWGGWTVSADGVYAVVSEGRPPRHFIDFHDLDSERTTRIAALERRNWGLGLGLSPDGQWLLYSQADRRESDILLVENFR